MTQEQSKSSAVAEIRNLIDAITKAVREKDVDAMLEHCASDIATFDMLPPLRHQGAKAIQALWAEALGSFKAPVEFEVTRLEVLTGVDIAFSRSLNRFGGTQSNGKRSVNWLCSTLGFRRVEGRWMLAHQHTSVPFDMETGKALLDLEP